MPLTVTQTKILTANLHQISELLKLKGLEATAQPYHVAELIAATIYELGPFITPIVAEEIGQRTIDLSVLPDKTLQALSNILDETTEELQQSIDISVPPGATFRELIAKLFEQFGPMIIQMIITMLLNPQPFPIEPTA